MDLRRRVDSTKCTCVCVCVCKDKEGSTIM